MKGVKNSKPPVLPLFANQALAYTEPLVARVVRAQLSAASNLLVLIASSQATYFLPGLPGTGWPTAALVMLVGTHLSGKLQFALMFAAVQSIRANSPGEEMMFFARLS